MARMALMAPKRAQEERSAFRACSLGMHPCMVWPLTLFMSARLRQQVHF